MKNTGAMARRGVPVLAGGRARGVDGRGGADYALRLSADGVEWMARDGFTREAPELRDARQAEGEEADRRKDWLTRELDARWREGRQ